MSREYDKVPFYYMTEPDFLARVKSLAKRLDIPVSHLIDRALDRYIGDYPQQTDERGK